MSAPEATRVAYGKALEALGGVNERVVALDADLSHATMTCLFAARYPERFFNMGIAEANMLCATAGMATMGLVPFCSTFALFGAGRGYEMIRNSVAYPNLNVKLCFSHGGVSIGEDGGSHQAIEDIALMRVLPGMTVIVPADALETRKAVFAAAAHEGPVYIRLSRFPTPVFEDAPFEWGRARVMRDGDALALFAVGGMVDVALACARQLSIEGVNAAVINPHTVKPLDAACIAYYAQRCGCAATLEDHSVIGGLGDAVMDALPRDCTCPFEKIGVGDVFGQSGKAAALMDAYGLSPARVLPRLRELVMKKRR